VDDTSAELVARWHKGEQEAADELFRRYAERLVALVRTRLSAKLGQRLDPEDVVQSVYRSLFSGIADGRFIFRQRGDLWRLLVAIALNKLHHQVLWHSAEKRAIQREQSLDADGRFRFPIDRLARDPSPEEAAALADELEAVALRLNPAQRSVFELRLLGHSQNEIAVATQRSQRTVRRLLDVVRRELEERFELSAQEGS
jgi:RNA polymerase sigma factor (sigma-70 family)